MVETVGMPTTGNLLSAITVVPMAVYKNLGHWTSQAQQNADAVGGTLQSSMSYALACQKDLMGFANMRLQKHMETGRQLAESRNSSDMIRILSDSSRTALEDYVKEIKELADLSLEMLPEGINGLEERAQAIVEDLPKVA